MIEAPIKTVHAVCPHDCPDTCSMLIAVDTLTGRAVKVAGDPDHPITRGFLCVKVNNYLDWTYNEKRVLSPQRRVGPKGPGARWERISWDEALATVTARIEATIAEYGAEAVLPYSYSGTLGTLGFGSMSERVWNKMGASRLARTICSAAGAAGYTATLGRAGGTDPEAFPDARLILVWGSNPVTSHVHLVPFLDEARRHSAMLIVIDPRRTRTARRADWHIQPRPGSDAALALAMMQVIVAEGLHDRDWIAAHTLGFEHFQERLQDYTPEQVAPITGLDPQTIRELARLYATCQPAAIRINYGLQRHTNGGMMVRTVACLPALVGAWKHPSGGMLLSTSAEVPFNMEALTRPDLLTGRAPRTINMIQLGEALTDPTLTPPVKLLFIYNADPANSNPDSAMTRAGLARDDLFTVVHDPFFTDTASYADILLPSTTQLEHLDLHKAYGHYYVSLNQPAIAPMGESVSNTELFRRLAAALGYDDACFQDSDEALVDQALASDDPRLAGITREALMARGWMRLNLPGTPHHPHADGHFPTPSGKVEFYSQQLAAAGFDPLPAHVPLVEGPETAGLYKRFPIQLVTPSAHHFLSSSFGAVLRLAHLEHRPTIELHPDDAAPRGIRTGDRCRVWNARGECQLYALVDATLVRPGVAMSPMNWWGSLVPGGLNANATTSQREADMGHGATFYTNLVEVARLDA
ncbi:MAG TPA: molybdopterin oxidoreductase [Chloroflexi bacterium]|nr:molybdopterin oxidoreductase [Chloroflexota bacterium]